MFEKIKEAALLKDGADPKYVAGVYAAGAFLLSIILRDNG